MPERPATWEDIVRHEATKARVPPQLALALMQQESGGRPDAVSEVGAQGLFQLMPATAKTLGIDPADPIQNIRGGVTYLRQQLDATGGDVSQALARYHGGPDLKQHGPKTQAYVQNIIGRLQGGAPGATAAPASPQPVLAPSPFTGAPRAQEAPVGTAPPSLLLDEMLKAQLGGPPPPVTAPAPPKAEPGILQSMAASVDPRTPEGRRNLAGGIGAAVATGAAAASAPVSVPVAIGVGALGAFSGGIGAELGEQVVGTKPPSTSAALGAGAEQAAYDVAGQALIWPVRAVGKRLIASRVGRYATEHLATAKQAVVDQTAAAIDAARSMIRGARTTKEGAIDVAKQGVAASKAAMTGAQAGAKAQTAKDVGTLEASLQGGIGTPPPSVAGRTAQRVISGPAKTAREMAGEAVEEAARQGPAVDITGLKAEAQRILDAEIKPPATAFPRRPIDVEGAGTAALTELGVTPEMVARMNPADQAAINAIVGKAQGEAESALLKHPAMGVLSRILNAGDTVSFAEAHAFKRELDEAVGTAWEKTVGKRVTNITKTLRGNLRTALDYGPYNRATEKYAAIAPLYTKEIAPKLRRLAETRPEALIDMLKGNQPTPARMLRELLTTQAAEGGGAAQGQAAWDLVRSTWTSEKLMRPGLDKLDATLAKLDPEFVDVLFGDASGKQVLTNLRAISTAYSQALAREPQAIAGARAGYDVARQQGAQAIRGARQTFEAARTAGETAIEGARAQKRVDLNRLREEAMRLGKSSLAGRGVSDEFWADLGRALMVPNTFWGARSIARIALRGAKSPDLLEWAIYSPANTQRMVRALTSPVPGEAVGDLLRLLSAPAKDVAGVGSAPPAPAAVGSPPPR